MIDIKKISDAYNTYLRPQTFPLAIKMCQSAKELPEKVRIPKRDMGIEISLCHAITMARVYGWVMAVDKFQSCYAAGLGLGFLPLLPDVVDGSYQANLGLWGHTKEQAAASLKEQAKFDYGKYQYALIAPLDKTTFEPDVFLFYGNPAQIWILLNAYLTGNGKSGLNITMKAGGGCNSYLVKTMQLDEAQFVIVGRGRELSRIHRIQNVPSQYPPEK